MLIKIYYLIFLPLIFISINSDKTVAISAPRRKYLSHKFNHICIKSTPFPNTIQKIRHHKVIRSTPNDNPTGVTSKTVEEERLVTSLTTEMIALNHTGFKKGHLFKPIRPEEIIRTPRPRRFGDETTLTPVPPIINRIPLSIAGLKIEQPRTHVTPTVTPYLTISSWRPVKPRIHGNFGWRIDNNNVIPNNYLNKLNFRERHAHRMTDDDNIETRATFVCKKFKESMVPFELEKMDEVWQTMYYRLSESIPCFQLRIRRVSPKERASYHNKYGNFSGAVNWSDVRMEITASTNIGRKHFLQGCNYERGVLENIIIARGEETGQLELVDESPNQWLVVQHLLLMRDCDNGGIVVFAKVPYVPRRREIEDALYSFHEEYSDGRLACDEEEVINKSIDAEDDVQSFWRHV